MFPKFIIETREEEGDCLILAKCNYHKELANDLSKVKGGGWWILDGYNSIFILHGESHDFGRAKIEDIKNCIQHKKVFSEKNLLKNITDNFRFTYKNQLGESFDL
jgi:hypothetical protein